MDTLSSIANPLMGFHSSLFSLHKNALISSIELSATGNIYGANIIGDLYGNAYANILSVTGNIDLDNVNISNTTFTSTDINGNLIAFAGNLGIVIPVGDTTQRPVSPLAGTTRFNSTLDSLETWDGTQWVTGGGGNSIVPGSITDQQVTPDGVSDTYVLIQEATSVGVIVSINGITQLPNVAYAVTGNSITFTQTPQITDLIDIRFISYITSVSSLSNSSGNSTIVIEPNGNIIFTTANTAFATMTSNLFIVNDDISSTGNITAPYFIGNVIGNISGNFVLPGLNTQIVYNNHGNVGTSAAFTFDQSSNTLTLSGNANISGLNIVDTTVTSIDTNGNLVAFAGTSGIVIPVGDTTQRPVSPPIGTMRFNSTLDSVETWDGTQWVVGGGNTVTPGTVIDQQITPDGTSDTYTLIQDSSSAGVIVTINGVSQLPNVAYDVTGNSITFLQIPQLTDLIDIRFITYFNSVSTLTNNNGNGSVTVNSNGNIVFVAGNGIFATMASNILSINGNISVNNSIISTPVPYASLTAISGARAFVNNSNLAANNNFGAQINGSGSNIVPVWSDGSNWYIG
jgi:hypothetical protein